MNKKMLDIYSDLLFANQSYATATSFSASLDGNISHDKFSRFLRFGEYDGKSLWKSIKTDFKMAEREKAILSFDDSIVEKPYTKTNSINCWHYSHAKGRTVKGINLLSCLAVCPNANIPVSYKLIEKPVWYSELETKKEKRKSKVSKNELMRDMFKAALKNGIDFDYALADNWFCCGKTLDLIHKAEKKFLFGIKSNRIVYKTKKDRAGGRRIKLSEFDLKEGDIVPVYLNLLDFQVRVMKRNFTNENGTQGTLYLVTNDTVSTAQELYNTYQKRWKIEEYHKSLKNNVSIGKSPTKTIKTQSNHIFAAVYAYAKLETIRIRTKMNHFSLKRIICIEALRAARKEIERLKNMPVPT